MSISLTVRGNRPCIEITDFRGEVWAYRYEIVTNTDRLLSVRLTKLEGADEPTYLVQVGVNWHRCDCPHFTYRPAVRAEGCKHLLILRDPDFRPLLALLPATTVSQERTA